MKTETIEITKSNLHKVKMSDLFESVLDDISRVRKLRIGIDMGDFFIPGDHLKHCYVCLGGAAICGFIPDLTPTSLQEADRKILDYWYTPGGKVDGTRFTEKQARRLKKMAYMFDSFRSGEIGDVFYNYESFSINNVPIHIKGKVDSEYITESFTGEVEGEDLRDLRAAIKRFVKILRKYRL